MLYDADIREPLFEFFEARHPKLRIMEELQMVDCIADAIIVLPDRLVGLEIKSDADSYRRLPRQVRDYDQVCDLNYVVVGSSHAKHILDHVPAWWGVLSVSVQGGGVALSSLREPGPSPQARLALKLRLLWRSELAHILSRLGLPKYAGKGKRFVRERLLQQIPAPILHEQISEELFERDYTATKK